MWHLEGGGMARHTHLTVRFKNHFSKPVSDPFTFLAQLPAFPSSPMPPHTPGPTTSFHLQPPKPPLKAPKPTTALTAGAPGVAAGPSPSSSTHPSSLLSRVSVSFHFLYHPFLHPAFPPCWHPQSSSAWWHPALLPHHSSTPRPSGSSLLRSPLLSALWAQPSS